MVHGREGDVDGVAHGERVAAAESTAEADGDEDDSPKILLCFLRVSFFTIFGAPAAIASSSLYWALML